MPNLSSFNIELSKNHAFLHNDRSLIPDYIYSDFSDKNECDFSADFAYVKNFSQLEKIYQIHIRLNILIVIILLVLLEHCLEIKIAVIIL